MGRREWLGFAVLCGWQASSWLLPDVTAGPSSLERLGVAFALAAMLAGALTIFGRKDRQRHSVSASEWVEFAAVSLLLFAVPAILLSLASDYATETNVTTVFAFAPVIVVLAWGVATNEQRGMEMLLPSLVGTAGVLLILPFEQQDSFRGWEALLEAILAMALVAFAGVWLHGLLRPLRLVAAVAVAGAANAVVLLAWCGIRGGFAGSGWRVMMSSITVATAVMFALTLWLVASMKPVRFSARFLVVPLLTILQGAVLLRPGLTARLVAGVVLLLAGSAWLLASREAVDDEVLSLR